MEWFDAWWHDIYLVVIKIHGRFKGFRSRPQIGIALPNIDFWNYGNKLKLNFDITNQSIQTLFYSSLYFVEYIYVHEADSVYACV